MKKNLEDASTVLADAVNLKLNIFEGKRFERVPFTLEELRHGFDPMQTQGVQHRRRAFHHYQNAQCQRKPHGEQKECHDNASSSSSAKRILERHGPQNTRQLGMRQRQRP